MGTGEPITSPTLFGSRSLISGAVVPNCGGWARGEGKREGLRKLQAVNSTSKA